jgi:hypothetical protein
VASVIDNLPILATTFSDFSVKIRSTLMTDAVLRPFKESGFNNISTIDMDEGTCEEIAESIRSLYLSFVSAITTAGLSFTCVSSEKGKGINTMSPVIISYFS